VSTPEPDAGRRPALVGLACVGGIAACGLGLSALYAATGIGVPCPFFLATGWACPFCGTTRMGAALLQGDLAAALAHNPVALVATAVLAVLGLFWGLELLGGPAVRPPAALRRRLRRVPPRQWLVLGLLAGLADVLLRRLL
jgi:hypothetical protein